MKLEKMNNRDRMECFVQPILKKYGLTKRQAFYEWKGLSVKDKAIRAACIKEINDLSVMGRVYLEVFMSSINNKENKQLWLQEGN